MNTKADIFRIKANNTLPTRGRVLISEPFLTSSMFGRSVVLLVDHTGDGSMGLVMNKQLPIMLNEVIKEFNSLPDIPIYKGGPLHTDTLFYLHTIAGLDDALPLGKGFYLNGDFNAVKQHVLEGHSTDTNLRFFLGYSSWEFAQLSREIEEDTWIVGRCDVAELLSSPVDHMWQESLGMVGTKYSTWSRFAQFPSLN